MSRGGSSSIPKEDTYYLMLKVNADKEVVPVGWSLSKLDENSAALVIDEPEERIYLWIGEGVDGITRAIARRKAADISSQGYKLENIQFPIGKVGTKRLDIVELNQDELTKDFKAKETYNNLKVLFRKKVELLEGGVLARVGVKIPIVKRELGEPVGRPPPKFEEVSKALEERFGRASEIIAERETMRGKYKEKSDDKVAAVYALAFVQTLGGKVNLEVSRQGEKRVYLVSKPPASETEQEKKCTFTVEDKQFRVLESNLAEEEMNSVTRFAEEMS